MSEIKELLRSKILDTAIELFIERGIEKTTTRALTEHLGISRSHIYHYFSDWHALCVEALKKFIQKDLDDVEKQIEMLSPLEQLNVITNSFLPDITNTSWHLYSSLWQQAVDDESFSHLIDSMTEQWINLIVKIIENGIKNGKFRRTNTLRTARQIGALLNGYSDLLIINSSPKKYQIALADINNFISLVLL